MRSDPAFLTVAVLAVVLIGVSPWAQASVWRDSVGVAWLNAVVQELRPLLGNEVSQHPTA